MYNIINKLVSRITSIDSNTECEAQLQENFKEVPRNCKSAVILCEGYNVLHLQPNMWLVIYIFEPVHVTINYATSDTKH